MPIRVHLTHNFHIILWFRSKLCQWSSRCQYCIKISKYSRSDKSLSRWWHVPSEVKDKHTLQMRCIFQTNNLTLFILSSLENKWRIFSLLQSFCKNFLFVLTYLMPKNTVVCYLQTEYNIYFSFMCFPIRAHNTNIKRNQLCMKYLIAPLEAK